VAEDGDGGVVAVAARAGGDGVDECVGEGGGVGLVLADEVGEVVGGEGVQAVGRQDDQGVGGLDGEDGGGGGAREGGVDPVVVLGGDGPGGAVGAELFAEGVGVV
jgi:hypothetical protein